MQRSPLFAKNGLFLQNGTGYYRGVLSEECVHGEKCASDQRISKKQLLVWRQFKIQLSELILHTMLISIVLLTQRATEESDAKVEVMILTHFLADWVWFIWINIKGLSTNAVSLIVSNSAKSGTIGVLTYLGKIAIHLRMATSKLLK